MRSTILLASIFPLLLFASAGRRSDADTSSSSAPGLQEEALRLMANGQFAAARQVLAGLVNEAERAGSPPGYRAGLFHLLGEAENRLGRYEEAKAALNHGLQLCGQLAAPELTIALLVTLAGANLLQDHLDEANQVLRRASGIASKDLPPGHPRLGAIQHSLGVLFWTQGQLSRAERTFRLSLAIFENSLGPDNADVAGALGGLAGILTMTARQAEAIPLLERSKSIFERTYGSGHPDTISATFALGVALLKSSPPQAESRLRQAVANWSASQPTRHPNMIRFLSALATSRYAQGDHNEAGILSQQALQLSRDIFGPEHPHMVAQMYEHAALLKATRRSKEGAALKKQADRIRTSKGYGELERHRIDILSLRDLGGRH